MPSSAYDPAGETRKPGTQQEPEVAAPPEPGAERTTVMAPVGGADTADTPGPQRQHGRERAPSGEPDPAGQPDPELPAAVGTADAAHRGAGPHPGYPDGPAPRWAEPGTEGMAVPPAAAPAEPATSQLPPALRTMTRRHWLVPVLAGLGGYLGTLIGTVIALAVALLGFAVPGDSPADLAVEEATTQLGSLPDSDTLGAVIAAPLQLAAMAALSPLRLVLGMDGDGLSLGALLPQYFALACGVAAAWFLTRAAGKRLRIEHRGVQWVMAVLAGLTWAAVALVVTALTAVRLEVPVFFTTFRVVVTGVSGILFAVCLLVGTLTVAAALNARVTQPAPGRVVTGVERAAPGLLQTARPVTVHALTFGIPVAIALVVYAFVKGGAVLGFCALLWLPLAAGWAFVLAHLSALTATGGDWLTDGPGSTAVAYLWSNGTVPLWAVVLLILLAVVSAVGAALSWARVRPIDERVAHTAQSWLVLPGVYFLLGLLVMWLLRVAGTFSGGFGEDGGAVALRPAGWTCVVFLVWGVAVELLARFVAPPLVGALPAGVTRVLRGSDRARGRAAVVAAAAALGAGAAASARPAGNDAAAAGPYDVAPQAFAFDAPDVTRPLPPYGAASDDGAGPGDGAPARAAREPMDPARKKRIRLIALLAGALVLLTVAAVISFSVLGRTAFGPGRQAEEFLGAVRDGNVQRATELADPNVNTERRGLLTEPVYGAAENRISSYSVRDTTIRGDTATVSAAVTQDNVTTPVTLNLVSDGREGLFRSWRVEDTGDSLYRTVSVQVPAGVGELTVNDRKVPVDRQQEARTVEYAALPGDYRVGIAADSKYMTFGDPRTARLRMEGSGYSQPLQFESAVTPALESELAKQVREKLDRCALSTEFEPEGCPFGYSVSNAEDYRNPSWSIVEYPTYTVHDLLDELTFTTDTSGEVRLDYQYNTEWDEDEPADWEDRDTSAGLYVSGKVVVSGDRVTVSLDSD